MRTPHRKVYAQVAGGGIGGLIAIILNYHFPGMPQTVAIAYSNLIALLLGFVAGYMTKSEDY